MNINQKKAVSEFFSLSVSHLDISQAIFAPSENSASSALPLTNTNLRLKLWFTNYWYPSTMTTLESLYTQRTTNYPRVIAQYIPYTGDQEDYIVWSCQTQLTKRCSLWVWTFPDKLLGSLQCLSVRLSLLLALAVSNEGKRWAQV